MVNFHNLFEITKANEESTWFWGLWDGIFIWEIMVTLDYEWSVIRGRRPYQWTIWIFSVTRVATLATVILNIYTTDVSPINCQMAISFQFIFSYLAFAASSLLIVLRIIAIWNRNRIVVALAAAVWTTNVSFLVQGILHFRSSWNQELKTCILHLDSIRLSTICAFVADTIFLLLMLFGIYRLPRHGGLMALGRLLWNQGVIWLLITVIAGLTPSVFILLNLNGVMDVVFQVPWVITMTIAATRMYRTLSSFLSFDDSQGILPTSGRTALEANSTFTTPFGSDIGMQPHGKSCELILDIVNNRNMEAARAQ